MDDALKAKTPAELEDLILNGLEAAEPPFADLLAADPEITAHLSRDELASLFDYGYYTRYVDESFRRIGLLP